MRAAVLVASLLVLSACKGDREKCAKAAQHYAELVYWERENAKIAELPAEQRDAARKRALVAFQRELDSQLDGVISRCVAVNNDDQADCINAAKTSAEALKCADLMKSDRRSGCAASGGTPAGAAALALLAIALSARWRRRERTEAGR